MRLHPVTSLMIVGVMLKLSVLAISLAGLVAWVIHDDAELIEPASMLGAIIQPMSRNLRGLAEAAAMAGAAFWVEALVRVHGRLQHLNLQASEEKAHA